MSSGSCFSSVLLIPQFFLWMWVAFFFISPSALFWIFALQLLVEKSIMFNYTTVYQSLYTMFSWFCSFHSASVPGSHSNSRGISPVYCSFKQYSILSSTYTTICSAIPQLKAIPSFSNFFLKPYLPSWSQYYVLVPRRKSGKGRQWGSSDLPRVTQLGSVWGQIWT